MKASDVGLPEPKIYPWCLGAMKAELLRLKMLRNGAAFSWPMDVWAKHVELSEKVGGVGRCQESLEACIRYPWLFDEWWRRSSCLIARYEGKRRGRKPGWFAKRHRERWAERSKARLPRPSASAMSRNEKEEFYGSREWKEARYEALRRCGGRCACCGARGGSGTVLHVDHIKPLWTNPELALELPNLQVLCESCNIGKGAKDKTDWREV